MGAPITEGRMLSRRLSDSVGFSQLSPEAAVLFCMIIPHLNSYGKLNGGPGFLKDEICPRVSYLTIETIPGCLEEISAYTHVKWFKHNGRYWIHALTFLSKYQKLNKERLGSDKLPSYTQELVESKSGVSQNQVTHEDKTKTKAKTKAKSDDGGPECDCPPFPDPEPEKEKTALEEKDQEPQPGNGEQKPELQEMVNQVKVKYPRLAIETWYGKNLHAREDAIIHVLKSLLKNGDGLRSEDPAVIQTYLQNALNVEIGKYNARDFDAAERVKKRDRAGGMTTMGDLVAEFKRVGGGT